MTAKSSAGHGASRRARSRGGARARGGLPARLVAIVLSMSLLSTGCTMIWKVQEAVEVVESLIFDATKLPERVAHWASMIVQAGSVCPEAPPELIAAQLMQESSFGLNNESPAGALGPAQFMPATWEGQAVDGDGDGVKDIMNPADAIASQGAYDCYIADKLRHLGGDTQALMLAGYNAGWPLVLSLGRIPRIKETQDYVRLIQGMMKNYQKPGAMGGMRGADAVIAEAMDFVRRRVPYVYGGESANGVDCSGLTQFVFNKIGINLRRTAQQQFDQFQEIPASQARPGDLVAFDLRDRANGGGDRQHIDHIGLVSSVTYQDSAGGLHIEMIQAPQPGDHVKVSPVNSGWYAKFNAFYVRVLSNESAEQASAGGGGWTMPVKVRYTPNYKSSGGNWSNKHTGVDFPAAAGTPIKAVGSGTVVESGWNNSYGNQIVIKHSDGKYTQYGHMKAPSRFKTGDAIRTGQEIGEVGSTGNSTGPHLHFEARKGPAYGSDIDPITYLRSKGLSPEPNVANA
ncbi:peptidoglycan DD-metalloendopeptidase family protein [Yinghuangia sp. ASG 101]|uniref:peptidoglycan DD-metalloendopeptidase family protein n=1 Tax=Yinghuangia sp. ASG 101 TaxID=2896848 RepID=UPI001E581BDF|nr:peptidoglycan DD-metalloendopeptidase family protein [Yinghuangia sp. ASG 101]UGQ09669.1 peptidoglycan DD-metalloendopeptidase family protein [Yinghuangia sp. ASG 101]